MNDEELIIDAQKLGRWERHKFMLLVVICIAIALVLVGISMRLYYSSGAAQVDLSHPDYIAVREQSVQAEKFQGISPTGTIDTKVLEEFRKLYTKQAEQATNVNSFGGDVMNDKVLSIDAPEPAVE